MKIQTVIPAGPQPRAIPPPIKRRRMKENFFHEVNDANATVAAKLSSPGTVEPFSGVPPVRIAWSAPPIWRQFF